MPRFVFWDCDNTLIANADYHWLKHQSVLVRHGYVLPADMQQKFFHNNGHHNWQWMVENIGLTIPCDDYLKEVDEWYHAHIHEIPLRDGVQWALDYFKENGARQCVVTNARRASVEPMLTVKNILPYFEFTWCREDYSERKPDPAPYATAHQNMERLTGQKIDLSDCIAIEDDPFGVTAAHLAGIKVIQRRVKDNDQIANQSDVSVYSEDDFIKAIKEFSL